MSIDPDGADLPLVTTSSDRGSEIQRRLSVLGISDREFHEASGIDRKTLRRAIANEDRVRPSTYTTIEHWLNRLEEKVSPRISEIAPQQDFVEFTLEAPGEPNIKVAMKGPIRDVDTLRRTMAALIADIRNAPSDSPPEDA